MAPCVVYADFEYKTVQINEKYGKKQKHIKK